MDRESAANPDPCLDDPSLEDPALESAALESAALESTALESTALSLDLASVRLKLDALPPVARRLVQAAAVLDEPACGQTLVTVAGVRPDQGEPALAEALRLGLLRECAPGSYELRPLTGQAVRDSITPAARRRLDRRIGGPEGRLSPREEQVIRLAAGGLTNRKIAEHLWLSPRTVEVHVANALRKLGLTSRRQLIDQRPPPD
ncbi:helix-turn-helix transcriptional regulator [Nonomuraea rhizosphaerae]|uniref:helix-turn-helix transcriptional regulator n=1 Tax=Nonomuraea rhizosphaerae TaxID=2665663 RepID=UPI0027E27B37|nr:LuxR C-terminal-related transcriptional regulator [Nonomuraea rhizosphaerae]